MKAINLDTYSLSLLTAKEDILNPRSSTNWALFTYVGITNNLKLSDSGVGGVSELAGKFHVMRPLYGLCRVGMDGQGPSRIVMIIWVGEGVDEYRRAECASHVPAVKTFFKEAHVFVNASRPEQVTEEQIRAIIGKLNAPKERVQRGSLSVVKEETVGTNYKRTIAAMEVQRFSRDSFWARAEKEEEDRKEEESRRAIEDRRRRERERIQQERREAEERERKMNEKEQMIQKQRKLQAEIEAEARRQEKLKWEQQQREHEEKMRARFRHSESIEKAAEAAVLVSQRSINPREFFRQLSSSSSHTPSNPSSPRAVRPPFRRYQRSLTDTAFIFGRSGSSTPSSPRSPPVVYPFSRTPTSPYHGSLSPPSPGCSDPTFRPITLPHQPHAPLVMPSTSPQRPTPTSPLPSLPPSRPLPPLSPQCQPPSLPHGTSIPQPHILVPPSPIPPAPPASPGPLPSFSQSQSSSLPSPCPLDSPPPVEAPTRPLPEITKVTSLQCLSQTEGHEPPSQIQSDSEVQAPVVEEKKWDDEETGAPEKEVPSLQASETATALAGRESSPVVDFQPSNVTVEETVPVLDSASSGEEDLESEAVPEGEPSADDGDENEEEEEEEGTVQPASLQEPILTGEADEGVELQTVCHPYQESCETGEVVDDGNIPQSPPQELSSLTANGMSAEPRGRDENDENGVSLESRGTGGNLSLSELDDDSGLSPSTKRHAGMEEVITEKQGEVKAENGEELHKCLDTDGQLHV
ncbi:hypothetical protein ANANG_G00261840 [Anguilla anguilla]|uniref:Drebrin n=1 Tax=Anguilla anguilla TaxID=7936 RepID=A0A9D3LTJ1_ANGAN|nr:hypothetical protein ANANG_G00261840 [Anguilla anguilla]